MDGIIYYIFKYLNISGKTLDEREADKLEKFVKELNLRGAEGRLANSGKYQVTSLCKPPIRSPDPTITANDDLSDLSDDDENLYLMERKLKK
ncbi:hypothetical protein EB796_007473 [Bugula neritina]|uniref:Uncharacterized protein n=1 Tax=Bugula neritina TaxID=10212 RepID=A0A7J7K8G0_BUGNE|nr:hypothetical protein EB796_007473 [Bugula neritina]